MQASKDFSSSSSSDSPDEDADVEPAILTPAAEKELNELKVAVAIAPSSFSSKALGIQGVERARSALSRCKICEVRIPKGDLRGVYQFDPKKPNGYVHMFCIGRMPPEFWPSSLEFLRQRMSLPFDDEDLKKTTARMATDQI